MKSSPNLSTVSNEKYCSIDRPVENLTVGQLKTYTFGIGDISGYFVIKVKIYRREKYWSIYFKEKYLDARRNDGCTR